MTRGKAKETQQKTMFGENVQDAANQPRNATVAMTNTAINITPMVDLGSMLNNKFIVLHYLHCGTPEDVR